MAAILPVTVGVPVFNGENYLREALERIRNQEYSDFEAVIRDNASSDGTADIAREYAAKDARFRYVRNEVNIGGARNCNAILRDTRSPYIVWAYHDDLLHPAFLKDAMARFAEAGPQAVCVYPRVALIDERGSVVAHHDDSDLEIADPSAHARLRTVLRRVVGQVQFGLMRSAVARTCGGVSESTAGEMILPAALSLRGSLLLASAEEARLYIRQHAQRSGGDRETEAAWVDPVRTRTVFPYSRSNILLQSAVTGAPLSPRERLASRAVVLWYWTRPGLRTLVGDTVRLPRDAGWVQR